MTAGDSTHGAAVSAMNREVAGRARASVEREGMDRAVLFQGQASARDSGSAVMQHLLGLSARAEEVAAGTRLGLHRRFGFSRGAECGTEGELIGAVAVRREEAALVFQHCGCLPLSLPC